jgi:hypothetical protein
MASTVPQSTGSGTLKATAIVSPLSYWFALNDSNQVAGEVVVEPTAYSARWSDGVTTKFASGGPDGGGGAFSIDDAGAVFGAVVNAAHDGYPAVWSPTGTLTKFTAQAGYEDSFNVRVYAASNNGNLVGVSNESHTSTTIHWFYALAPGYAVVPVVTSTGAGFPSSMAINNSGTIAVGNATTPYLLVNGVRRSLKVSITTNFDLNNNGDVAGTVVPAPTSGNSQAAIELANGTVQVLPPLHAGDEVSVKALNDNDEAVGSEYSPSGTETAVAWINGKPVAVTSLVGGNFSTPLSTALDVNNNGSILAQSGSSDYYLLGAPSGALSVAEVTRGTGALSADVRVKLSGSLTDASGCDPKASYDFTDPQLSSVKEVGPCNYELKFEAPGTGIYHFGLKATVSPGVVVPVSVDQYGETVDGQFTLIIDSCSEPDDDVPDVDALLDSEPGLCAVAVGDWDSDAADVAAKVLAAVESSPTFAVDPVSVDSVDPSDWPGSRGLVSKRKTGSKGLVLKSTGTGWVPIGTKDPPELSQGWGIPGDAAALATAVYLPPPLPHGWSGASEAGVDQKTGTVTCPGVNPDDRSSHVVISSHGLWYTANGLMRVPAGDQISTYVPIGSTMLPCLTLDVDTGHVHSDDTKYLHVYTAGQLMPNFTFVHFDEPGQQGKHVVNPDSPITINNLVRPGEGLIAIGACASLYIPAGVTLAQAFSSLPVRTPGSGDVIGYSRVTITKNGELQTTPASP